MLSTPLLPVEIHLRIYYEYFVSTLVTLGDLGVVPVGPIWFLLECWVRIRAWELNLIVYASQYDLEAMCSSRLPKKSEGEVEWCQMRLGASDLSCLVMQSALWKVAEGQRVWVPHYPQP